LEFPLSFFSLFSFPSRCFLSFVHLLCLTGIHSLGSEATSEVHIEGDSVLWIQCWETERNEISHRCYFFQGTSSNVYLMWVNWPMVRSFGRDRILLSFVGNSATNLTIHFVQSLMFLVSCLSLRDRSSQLSTLY
jgi:hypothetical protein